MIRRIRSAPAPFSSIEPWYAKRRFEQDCAETSAVDFRTAPAREVLLHLNRLMDWAAFWARRGLTEADRQDARDWEGRWRELQPHVIEAVERGDEHAVH